MDKYRQIFNDLYYADSFKDITNIIDSIALSSSFNELRVLVDFYFTTSIQEEKIYIIRSFKSFRIKNITVQPLIEISYDRDQQIKIEVLKAMLEINNIAFAERVFELYKLTKISDKKILALKILSQLNVSKYAEYFINTFAAESEEIKVEILVYLTNISSTSYSDSIVKEVLQIVNDETIFQDGYRKQNSYNISKKLIFAILLLKKYNKLNKIDIHNLLKFEYVHFLVNNIIQCQRTKSSLKPEIVFKKMLDGDESFLIELKYSDEILDKLLPNLEKKLQEFDNKYSTQVKTVLSVLIKISNDKIFDLFLKQINKSHNINYLKILIDTLCYFNFNKEQSQQFSEVLFTFFEIERYSRINDIVIRALIIIEKHQGIKKIYDFFNQAESIDAKSQILYGLHKALMTTGYIFELNPSDKYIIELLISECVSILLSKKDDANFLNSIFTINALWFIKNIKLDMHVDDILELVKYHPENEHFISVIENLMTEKCFLFTQNRLNQLLENIPENKHMIKQIIQSYCKHNISKYWEPDKDLIKKLMRNPYFTIDIIKLITKMNLKGFSEDIIAFIENARYRLLYSILQYFKINIFPQNLPHIIYIFQNNDMIIKKEAALIICRIGNSEDIESVLRYYLFKKKSPDDLIYLLDNLQPDDHSWKIINKLFSKLKDVKIDERFTRIFNKYLYRAFQQGWPLGQLTDTDNDHSKMHSEFVEKLNKSTELINDEFSANIKNEINTAELLYQNIKNNPDQNYDYFVVLYEYKQYILDISKNLIKNKIENIFNDETYINGVTNIFKNEYNYIDFIKRKEGWSQIQLDPPIINKIIKYILTGNKNKLIDYLDSFKKILIFFSMILHKDQFYAIDNPLQVNIDFLQEKDLIFKLNNFFILYEKYIDSHLDVDLEILDKARDLSLTIGDVLKAETN